MSSASGRHRPPSGSLHRWRHSARVVCLSAHAALPSLAQLDRALAHSLAHSASNRAGRDTASIHPSIHRHQAAQSCRRTRAATASGEGASAETRTAEEATQETKAEKQSNRAEGDSGATHAPRGSQEAELVRSRCTSTVCDKHTTPHVLLFFSLERDRCLRTLPALLRSHS